MVELPNEEILVDETSDTVDAECEDVRRMPNAVRRRKYAFVQQTGVWDELKKDYEEGRIGSLSELSTKIKEQTGVDISVMTLSRRLRSTDKRLISKRKFMSDDETVDDIEADLVEYSSSEDCYRSLSRRLCATMLTVAEAGGVRQYTRTRTSADGLKEYFRCNKCYFHRCKTGGGVIASVSLYKGRLVGEKHPRHHEKCELVAVEHAAVIAVDRESRLEVRAGQKDPREAHSEAFARTVRLASSSSAPAGRKLSMSTMFPSWHRVRKSYYRHRRSGLGDASTHTPKKIANGVFHNDVLAKDFKCARNLDEALNVLEPVTSFIPSGRRMKKPDLKNCGIEVIDVGRFDHATDDMVTSSESNERSNADCLSGKGDVGEGMDVSGPPTKFCAAEHTLPSPSKVTGRRHYLKRDPVTGRITVCNRTPHPIRAENIAHRHMNGGSSVFGKEFNDSLMSSEDVDSKQLLEDSKDAVLVDSDSLESKMQSKEPSHQRNISGYEAEKEDKKIFALQTLLGNEKASMCDYFHKMGWFFQYYTTFLGKFCAYRSFSWSIFVLLGVIYT
uniref:MADF domain-containing protein n=1 Tax=Parascaris univalens TaxID=6257 RepID=A0A915C9P5_PARUN